MGLDSLLKEPIVLISPSSRTPDYVGFEETVASRIKLIDFLTSEGYTVKSPGPLESDGRLREFYVLLCRKIAKARPSVFVHSPVVDTNALFWPRDVFQVYGTEVCVVPGGGAMSYVTGLLQELGARDDVTLIESEFGEGGCVVSSGPVYLVSEIVEGNTEPLAVRVGSRRYLPSPAMRENGTALSRRAGDHIDMELNIVTTPAGEHILLVNEKYRQTFEPEVTEAADRLSATMLTVPDSEYSLLAVNFITLPDGRILLPEGSSVQPTLVDRLGKKNVLPYPVDQSLDYGAGGGLRCSSNVIH